MTPPGALAGAPPPGEEPAGPLLSVVVATIDAEHSIEACLAALRATTDHVRAEIFVVDASNDGTRQRVSHYPWVRTITAPAGTLVPSLWARGLQASHGRFVAFTLGQCIVSQTWADRMMAACGAGVAGAGGAFSLAPGTRAASWALFFLRYSNFIEERWTAGPVAGEIAGDNALYRRQDLEACGPFVATGFWEVDVHRQLRQRGLGLAAVSGATAAVMTRSAPLRVVRERFRHGRHFGAYRAAVEARRLRRIAAAPLVPAVLVWRAARRVWPYANHRRRFVAAVPWMLLFATAWASGESVGALRGSTRTAA